MKNMYLTDIHKTNKDVYGIVQNYSLYGEYLNFKDSDHWH